jgi:hypothetical protein
LEAHRIGSAGILVANVLRESSTAAKVPPLLKRARYFRGTAGIFAPMEMVTFMRKKSINDL